MGSMMEPSGDGVFKKGHEAHEAHDHDGHRNDHGRNLLYEDESEDDDIEWGEIWDDEWNKFDDELYEWDDGDDEGFIAEHEHVEDDYWNKTPVVCLQIMIAADNVIVDGFIFSQQSNLIFRDRAKPVVANLTTLSPTKYRSSRPTTLRPTNTPKPTKQPSPPKTPRPTRSPN